MSECTGREILEEILLHLHFAEKMEHIRDTSIVIPAMMPYITSQFMPRTGTDRPQVIPAGSKNLAFIGQFTEIPDDVVFTVEYSVRSAQSAVFGLLDSRPEGFAFLQGATRSARPVRCAQDAASWISGHCAGKALRSLKLKWRRRWDSNPRYHLWYTPLAGERLRPLGHLSGAALIGPFIYRRKRFFISAHVLHALRRPEHPAEANPIAGL